MVKRWRGGWVVVLLVLAVTTAWGDGDTFEVDGRVIGFHREGVPVTLPLPGDYEWWYGCSPTSADMVMGHYDVHGYSGYNYDNFVPGGDAENSTFSGPGPFLANDAIASSGHISDFYGGGYLASGDDVAPPWHSFNCLADFMGTSQDSCGNVNGSTGFYYFLDGVPFTESDAVTYSVTDPSGMYGIGEYIEYAGYDANVLYNQLIPGVADWLWPGNPTNTEGFTFAQYMAEIDAGRPVLIHVESHTMYGFGYDSVAASVILNDTWAAGPHSMTWGGSYDGLYHYGVTALEPVPEPATIALLGLGALAVLRKRKR